MERPIVHAGMGGGLAPHALAVAVSEAGGLGTIGFVPAGALRAQIAAARRRTKRPLAVNLLLPFARQAHFDAAEQADVFVTFWGRPRRQTAKARLVESGETVVTELFGAGWPAPHRVLRNAATEHWLRNDPRGPGWLRTLNRITAPAASRLPMSQQQRLLAAQRPNRPIFGPSPPLADSPPRFVDAAPLYAGETVARIGDVRAAGELVAELAR